MNKILIFGSALLLFNLASAQDLTTMELTVPENISELMPRVNMHFTLKIQNDLAEGEKSPLLIWMHGGGGGVDRTLYSHC